MNAKTRAARMLTLALTLAAAGCVHAPPEPDMRRMLRSAVFDGEKRSATLPFIFDGNRVFVEVSFILPNGVPRKALAWVNMGSGSFVISNALFREINPGPLRPLRMNFAGLSLSLDGGTVMPEGLGNAFTVSLPLAGRASAADMAKGPGGQLASFHAPLKVEATIPPGLLQNFQVVFDHAARTMTLAAPGTLNPEGVAVPMRVNAATGFASVDVTAKGRRHALVIDNGGSYTTLKDADAWLATPQDVRSSGAIGMANLMSPGDVDIASSVVRLSPASLGDLRLDELDAQEVGLPGALGLLFGGTFWSSYSHKAGETTEGWIGGNLLKSFRLTLDYPGSRSYWLQQAPLDTSLDQVGVILGRGKDGVTVAGIARKSGVETVTGLETGDRLLQIGTLDVSSATRGQLLEALHGKPGEIRRLVLERGGRRLEVDVPVTAF